MRAGALILVVFLLLAGCSSPAPPPPPPPDPPPGPPPGTPAPGEPSALEGPLPLLRAQLAVTDGHGYAGYREVAPGEEAAVGTERFLLRIWLARSVGPVPYDWAPPVEGAAPDLVRASGDGIIEYEFPAGPAGEQLRLRFPTIRASGDQPLELRLIRRTEPAVVLEVKAGAGWRAVTDPWEVLPAGGPLAVRLRFSQPLGQSEVEQALSQSEVAGERGTWRWDDDRTLVWEFAQPPALLAPNLRGLASAEGLPLTGSVPVLQTGQPPYLAAVDPATGGERRVADAPPDIVWAQQQGSLVAVYAYRRYALGTDYTAGMVLYDVAAGTRTEVAGPYHARYLRPDGHFLEIRGAPAWGDWQVISAAGDVGATGSGLQLLSAALSPDGARLAGLTPGQWGEAPPRDRRLPHAVAVVDIATGERREFANLVKVLAPESSPSLPEFGWRPAWSADGRRLAVLSEAAPGQPDLLVIDLDRGRARRVAAIVGLEPGWVELAWSPDAHLLVVGSQVVRADTGQVLHRLPAAAPRNAHFSPDGRHLLYSAEEWGPVRVHDLSAGTIRELGHGLPAGWHSGQALVFRWAGAAHRIRPMFQ